MRSLPLPCKAESDDTCPLIQEESSEKEMHTNLFSVRGIHVDATIEQRPVHVRDHRPHVPVEINCTGLKVKINCHKDTIA